MSEAVTLTVVGWVATQPRLHIAASGADFTSFRLATTPRRRGADGTWTDGRTEWFTVKTWRTAAHDVAASLAKGQPVIATGRLVTHEWQAEDGPRTDLVLEARAVGHDLTRGRASFVRTLHEAPGEDPDAVTDGEDEVDTARGVDDGHPIADPFDVEPPSTEPRVLVDAS